MESSAPMDTTTPSKVDGVDDAKSVNQGKSKAGLISTRVGRPGKPKPVLETNGGWDIEEFCKDAQYFCTEFGLPNQGDNPSKISGVTVEMLEPYFGSKDPVKDKNVYKVGNIAKLNVQHILHLAQVVDGYEKPVNGVLATMFVRGIYAERVQGKKVNWALYAESKLRGQVTMWARDGKTRPDCPPCVRKLRLYIPPIPEDFDEETKELAAGMSTSEGLFTPVVATKAVAIKADHWLRNPGPIVPSKAHNSSLLLAAPLAVLAPAAPLLPKSELFMRPS
ncbi:unnamed protein product [Calypogeia fissa]